MINRYARTWISWTLLACSLVLTALSLALMTLNWRDPHGIVFPNWLEDTILATVVPIVGVVIVTRCPENAIGWIFCLIGVLAAVDHAGGQYAIYALLVVPQSVPGGELAAWVRGTIWEVNIGILALLGLLFPDGRLPSRRWWPFAWLIAGVMIVGFGLLAIARGPLYGLSPITNPVGFLYIPALGDGGIVGVVEALVLSLTFVAALSLFMRLRRASGVERQQLKWFAYAAAITVGGAITNYIGYEWVHVTWVWWISFVPLVVGLVGLPMAVGIAILRYRLYDIDLIINRTLVYGTLTGLLVLIYAASIVTLQSIVQLFTDVARSGLVTVASTLAIAALFQPLRRRIQAIIDRRFYRQKYDSARVLESFTARLRDETDLDMMTRDVLDVVQETLQPAHVSLWLCEPAEKARL